MAPEFLSDVTGSADSGSYVHAVGSALPAMFRAAIVLALSVPAQPQSWADVDAVLENAVTTRVFPCAAALVVNATTGSIIYSRAVGNLVYADSPSPPFNNGTNPEANTSTTLFDMASLSKIIGPTTVAALLFESGDLDLDERISSAALLGPEYSTAGKDNITVRLLLLHAAGFPPDPVPSFNSLSFSCPNSNSPHPALDFSCAEAILAAVYNQTLASAPGSVYLYSDLSMITLLLALGRYLHLFKPAWAPASRAGPVCEAALNAGAPPAVQYICAFHAFWRVNVSAAIGFSDATGYLPAAPWAAAPTWLDTDYRFEQLQGVVSDENSYASGGIAGHAGIFSSGDDAARFLAAWSPSGRSGFLSAETIELFTTRPNIPPGSPRALGWSTEADSYAGCAPMPVNTAYHTGYTGTQLCLGTEYATLLLSARVFPNKTGSVESIHETRQAFNAAVAKVLVSGGV